MEHLSASEVFPSTPGIHFVDPAVHAATLFELDCAIAVGGSMLPFESQEELTSFLTEAHVSDTYVINNEAGSSVGCMSVVETSPETLEVLSIGVLPETNGQGYGTTLMLWAEELARQTDRPRLHLVTKVSNEHAIRFYENLGYKQTGVVGDHYSEYGDDEPRVRLEKLLGY